MTQEQRLKKLNNKTSDEIRLRDLKHHWEITDEVTEMPKPTLSHIHHTARLATMHPTKELIRQTEKLLKLYPQYKANVEAHTIANNFVSAYVFHLLGHLTSPIMPYLVYLTWMDWKVQQKTRTSLKRRRYIYFSNRS